MPHGSFDNELSKLTDDARRRAAARERLHHADRSLAAALSGTFAGTLTELAETRSPVNVHTRSGAAIRGTVLALGPDVVVLDPNEGRSRVLVRRLAIEALVEQGDGHDRHVETISTGPELAELLDELSVDGERVALTLSTGNRFMGSMRRVGIDQVVMQLDGDGDTITVPLHAIDQAVLAR